MTDQFVPTPIEFIAAVEKRFGPIGFDLAANATNRVKVHETIKPIWFGPGGREPDALAEGLDWPTNVFNWLNPPFDNIEAFAKKAAEQRQLGARIAMIGPASVCTGWFVKYVAPHAYVFELTPRVFKVQIRDCILALYEPSGYRGRETWRWKP